VPFTVMQSHQITIAVFIVYSVINGMAKTGIDNAAHAGGLVAGCVLGWALARPIGDARRPRPLRAMAGVLAVCLVAGALFARTPNTGAGLDAIARFRTDMQWLDGRERQLVAATQAALATLRSGKASAHTAREIAEIAQGWAEAHQKFSAYRLDPRLTREEYVALHREIVTYLDLRRSAMLALATAARSSPPSTDAYREFSRLWKESQAALEGIDKRAKAVSK
jgi:rhomboid protease GluP